MDEETLSPERDDDNQEGEKFPLDKFEGTGAMYAPKEVLKDSGLLLSGDEGGVRVLDTTRAASHLIEPKDRFSELGIPLISRRLAFQGPDIDPYLRYAIQVDVASMVKELGEMLRLDPSEAGTSSQVSSRTQPALPEDVESFDVDGKLLSAWFSLFFPVL